MRDRVKWKAAARIALNGKYGTAIGAMFLIMAVQWAAGLAVEVLVLGGTFALAFQDSRRLLITPHIAWASREARQLLVQKLEENLKSFLDGGRLNRVC